MNCEEAQKQLSEYTDKVLGVEEAASVDAHLADCARCTEELASLVECRRLVSKLPEIEPPIGFATRVMAQVREAENKPGLWKRLFFPLRIKIPLQATALAMIGILAVYLFEKEQPDKSLVSTRDQIFRVEEKTEQNQALPAESQLTAQPFAEPRRQSSAREEATALRDQRSSDKKDEAKVASPPAPAVMQAQQKPGGESIEAAGAGGSAGRFLFEDRREGSPQSDAPAEVQGQVSKTITGATGVSQRPATPRVGAPAPAALSELRSGSLQSGSREPAADIEIVVRRRPPLRQDQAVSGDFDSLRKRAERDPLAEFAERKSAAPPAAPKASFATLISWHTVPADRYEQFKRDLATEGIIESETSRAAKEKESPQKSDRPLSIKVTILPPLVDQPAPPSEPSAPSR